MLVYAESKYLGTKVHKYKRTEAVVRELRQQVIFSD